MAVIDLEKASKEFKPLPNGRYKGAISDVQERISGNGNLVYRVVYKVIEGEHSGRYLRDDMPILDSTMWRVTRFLKACGLKGQVDLNIELMKGFIGKVLMLRVYRETREEEGEKITRNRIVGIKPVDDSREE